MAFVARPFLSVVTVMDIEIGIFGSDAATEQAESLRRWITKTVMPGFEVRIPDFDTGASRRY